MSYLLLGWIFGTAKTHIKHTYTLTLTHTHTHVVKLPIFSPVCIGCMLRTVPGHSAADKENKMTACKYNWSHLNEIWSQINTYYVRL